jgi:hypothetical protein
MLEGLIGLVFYSLLVTGLIKLSENTELPTPLIEREYTFN